MPDTDRSGRGDGIARTLRRWWPFPGRRAAPDRAPGADAGAAQDIAGTDRATPPLLWCHADSAEALAPLAGLLQQLAEEGDPLEFLLTSRGLLTKQALGDGLPDGIALGHCPSEEPAAIRRFLDRRRPDVCVWAGGAYAPNLIAATLDGGIPVINVNAVFPRNIWRRARGVRRSLRQLMERFHAIYALDEAACDGLLKFGLPEDLVRTPGRLTTPPPVLPHDEALRSQLGRAIGTRPVWLACGVRPDELSAVLEAFRDAARLTHRLLLVLVPANRRDTARFNARLARGDYRIAVRSAGEEPVYDTQIVLEDTGTELGLWLRIAPVSFLGNSLTRGGGTDPMLAAALGSAILHGPFVSTHREAYARLTDAGAAVEVSSARSLAEAVCEISTPDRAANMAHAAWQVESQGAEVIRRVERDILDCLQSKGTAA